MHYSSKDFSKTMSSMVPDAPKRLCHPDVRNSGLEKEFSSQRKHGVAVVDLPSRTMSMTWGHLAARQSTNRHRHSYETLIYIIRGSGYSEIDGRQIPWTAGDAIYVPVWAWHKHVNGSSDSEVEYIACENAPLLQNLGGLALREEACDP